MHAAELDGDLVTTGQAEGRIAGILLEEHETEQRFTLRGYDVVARNARELLGQMPLDAGVAPTQRDGGRSGRADAG